MLVLTSFTLGAQVIPEMEFYNKPVRDILLALSDASGKLFVIDQTISGSTSYFFREMEIGKALDIFLSANDCFYEIRDGVYYVSKIQIIPTADNLAFTVNAEGVYIQDLIAQFSKTTSLTVVYDGLPRETISIHIRNAAPEIFLQALIKKYPDYSLETNKGFYYIKYRPASRTNQGFNSVPITMTSDGRFSIQVEQARFREILLSLFQMAGREYSLLGKNDPQLSNINFKDKSFDEMLTLILDLGDSDYSLAGKVYYIVDIQRNDILKKYYTTVYLPLTYLNVMELPGLFPNGLVNSASYKTDKPNNAIILYGTVSEIGPIQDFIVKIDKPGENREYCYYNLNYIDPDRIRSLLPLSLQMVEIIPVKETGSIIALVAPEKKRELESFLAAVDSRREGVPVRLKYIKADDLLANLPPSANKEDIIKTVDPTLVFFKGSKDKLDVFLRELEMVDRPVPQIRYELLIIQNSRSRGINWDAQSGAANPVNQETGTGSPVETDPVTAVVGTFSSLLGVNFDVVSSFGYKFGLNLSLSLSLSDSQIMTDTQLTGLSGQKVSFQNTDTFRYRDIREDDETGDKEVGGTSQEITSGIFLDITSWVSGDGTVTMEISATVSKQNSVDSTDVSILPPTSEKVVKTHVRTRSGEPVVISGLIQQDKVAGVDKIPVLGDIPILGLLFQKRSEKMEESEMVIYLIPFVEGSDYDPDDIHYFERLYRRFVGDE
jgi:type II secretory pathway component GspD/PulD (secretin)